MANENFKTFKALDSYIVFANTADDKTLKQPLELLSVLAQKKSSSKINSKIQLFCSSSLPCPCQTILPPPTTGKSFTAVLTPKHLLTKKESNQSLQLEL